MLCLVEPRLKERDSKWGQSSRVKFLPPLWAEVNPDDLSFNFSDALVCTSPSLPPSCTRPFYSRASCLIVHPSGRPPEEEEKETSGDTFKSGLLKRGKDVLQLFGPFPVERAGQSPYCWLLDKANGINKPDISFGYVHTANPMKTQHFLPCSSAGTVSQCCCHC